VLAVEAAEVLAVAYVLEGAAGLEDNVLQVEWRLL
jgi:hypothetical protein